MNYPRSQWIGFRYQVEVIVYFPYPRTLDHNGGQSVSGAVARDHPSDVMYLFPCSLQYYNHYANITNRRLLASLIYHQQNFS